MCRTHSYTHPNISTCTRILVCMSTLVAVVGVACMPVFRLFFCLFFSFFFFMSFFSCLSCCTHSYTHPSICICKQISFSICISICQYISISISVNVRKCIRALVLVFGMLCMRVYVYIRSIFIFTSVFTTGERKRVRKRRG